MNGSFQDTIQTPEKPSRMCSLVGRLALVSFGSSVDKLWAKNKIMMRNLNSKDKFEPVSIDLLFLATE